MSPHYTAPVRFTWNLSRVKSCYNKSAIPQHPLSKALYALSQYLSAADDVNTNLTLPTG